MLGGRDGVAWLLGEREACVRSGTVGEGDVGSWMVGSGTQGRRWLVGSGGALGRPEGGP